MALSLFFTRAQTHALEAAMSFHFTKAPASILTQSESSLALGAMTRAQRAYVPASTLTVNVTRLGPTAVGLSLVALRYEPPEAAVLVATVNVGLPLRAPASASSQTVVAPGVHAAHVPPQSTPVSVPFCTPSVHVGVGGHAGHVPPQSTPVSVPFCPRPSRRRRRHAGHVPPQSTPVSVPFLIPSVHVGAGGQAGHEPPQSTPVSVPFCVPSVQVGPVPPPRPLGVSPSAVT